MSKIHLKTDKEISLLREGGKRLASILHDLSEIVFPGQSSFILEEKTRKLVEHYKGRAAFLNYQPAGAPYPYPAALCLSINDEIVHGIPNKEEKIIKDGDLVSLDMGFTYEGLVTDSAITIGVGNVDRVGKELIRMTHDALYVGIKAALPGHSVDAIGTAIEGFVKSNSNFSIFEELVGHGVGYSVHEDPVVPNFHTGQKLPKLDIGTVIAIEPMLSEGSNKIKTLRDGYTYVTRDGSRSAHFEHTVAITENGPQILTAL